MITEDKIHQINCSEEFVPRTLETQSKDQVVSWAEELVKKFHGKTPPIDVEKLAVEVGIKQIHKANISVDGILVPVQDGFILTVNENHHPTRQRFTCAHEIAHTFFAPSKVKLRTAIPNEATATQMQSEDIEHLCNIAAKHILMPEQMFKQASLKLEISIDAIVRLADIFQTSITATAIRFVETSREPLILIFSQVFERPESCSKLRVRWATQKTKHPDSNRYFIPPYLPIDEESKILQAYKTQSICRGFEDMRMANLKGAYYIESKGFGSDESRYVISLVFPEAQSRRLI